MVRKAESKMFTSFCFPKILLLYTSLVLLLGISFICPLWFFLISIPILIVSTSLHALLSYKKQQNLALLERSTAQEGKPFFPTQEIPGEELTIESDTNPETSVKTNDPQIEPVDAVLGGESLDREDDEEEDNLIEIALIGAERQNQQQNLQKFSSDSALRQEELVMEIWTEVDGVNEEENLIEIDISMGSIISSQA